MIILINIFNTIFILLCIQNITGTPNPSFHGDNKFSFNPSNQEKNQVDYEQLVDIAYKHGKNYEFGT